MIISNYYISYIVNNLEEIKQCNNMLEKKIKSSLSLQFCNPMPAFLRKRG